MRMNDPITAVTTFNDCINRQDLDALAGLMSEDHVFVDSSHEVHAGKETMVAGWKQFFKDYPDYQNHFEHIEARDNLVVIVGHSTCSHKSLDGPALWTARVIDGLVQEWRVYEDTLPNRELLNLPRYSGPHGLDNPAL
jgi:ketosteroid isomerase-like protein